MNYSHKISDMVWSYSRIGCYTSCPYQFLLGYISKEKKQDTFFADFGSLIHTEMERYLNGVIPVEALTTDYILHFKEAIKGKPPTQKMYKKYFQSGIDYLKDPQFPFQLENILWVEEKLEFALDDIPFVGIVDCLIEDPDHGLILLDHKSRQLKARSPRRKKPPTKSDLELDDYLRQLYLYSYAVKDKLGKFPDRLAFNCFRNDPGKRIIVEPFREEKAEEVRQWAIDTVHEIIANEDWSPNMQFWQCNHLCSYNQSCEYFTEHDGKW